jgi:hypothetical protein
VGASRLMGAQESCKEDRPRERGGRSYREVRPVKSCPPLDRSMEIVRLDSEPVLTGPSPLPGGSGARFQYLSSMRFL